MSEMIITQKNGYSQEQIDLIKRNICKGATNDELALFVQQCAKTGLDPFTRQIYSLERKTKNGDQWETVRQTMISIDGQRLVAERTGKYEGQVGPYWCGKDGQWKDVWLSPEAPLASKVGIYKKGFREPLWGVATYKEYVQLTKNQTPNAMWTKFPSTMLAKCAESLGLRKAFPMELSGLYTTEEMGQANNDTVDVIDVAPTPQIATPQQQTQPMQQIEAPKQDDYPGDDFVLQAFELPNDFNTLLTIDDAVEMKDSNGMRYGDKSIKELYKMHNAMISRLERNNLSEKDRLDIEDKLDAVYLILDAKKKEN